MNNDIKLNMLLTEQTVVRDDPQPRTVTPAKPKVVQDLKTWLEVATEGLVQTEKLRIQTEIQEHFETALESYQITEHDLETAKYKALTDLGNAYVANQHYQKIYFNYDDKDRLAQLQKPSWWGKIVIYLVPIAVAAMFILPESQQTAPLKSFEKWSVLFWLVMTKEILFWFGCFYEAKIKLALLQKYPAYGVFLAQAFVIILATPHLYEIVKFLSKLETIRFNFNINALIVMGCSFFWLKAQLPLTIKTIRRLRT